MLLALPRRPPGGGRLSGAQLEGAGLRQPAVEFVGDVVRQGPWPVKKAQPLTSAALPRPLTIFADHGSWHHRLVAQQPKTPGCGCYVVACVVVIGSFLITVYGGDIYFPAVLLIASIALVSYIAYWLIRLR